MAAADQQPDDPSGVRSRPGSPSPGPTSAPLTPEQLDAMGQEIANVWRTFFASAFVALGFNGISGDYVEFGSYGGTTLWLAYEELQRSPIPRHLWAFDSFEGLPDSNDPRDHHPAWVPNTLGMELDQFHRTCKRRGVPREAYTTVRGFYEDSLPALGSSGAPTDIALAYVDCDMYSSAVSVLEFLEPRLKHGMIVAMDDYYCWTATEVSGERVALHEFLTEHPEWHFHRYRDIGWAGTSFVVERTELLRGA